MRTSKQLEPLEALLRTRPDGSLGILASGLSAADVLRLGKASGPGHVRVTPGGFDQAGSLHTPSIFLGFSRVVFTSAGASTPQLQTRLDYSQTFRKQGFLEDPKE